jgi:hypothetical protein
MIRLALLSVCSVALLVSGTPKLPLPEAPVRLVIPDVRAFDRVLSGSYRQMLEFDLPESDPMLAAWKRTRTGSKLDAEWEAFRGRFSLNWRSLQAMQPSSIGIALLNVGHLEAVMVIETSLAVLSHSLPNGDKKTHNGVSYNMIAKGAADANGSNDQEQRIGFAWASFKGNLFLASSERALKLALDAAISGNGYSPSLEGLVCLDLNLDELRGNLYFKREFPFPKGPETGHIHAALRQQGGNLVEVRRGVGEPRAPVFKFDADSAAIAGWEPDGGNFWPAFRRALLEPEPNPPSKPLPAIRPLPTTTGKPDNYLVDFTKPSIGKGSDTWEEGDLLAWPDLLADVSSYGYYSRGNGQRRLVFPWPIARDADFVNACKASMTRRHGRATIQKIGDIQEIQVGPKLPVLAIRRTGAFLWVAANAAHLKEVKAPLTEPDLIRWAKLDLNAIREEYPRWEKLEGPQYSDLDRPLSDRVLGLLGWMPKTVSVSVERKKTGSGWEERVVFGGKQ